MLHIVNHSLFDSTSLSRALERVGSHNTLLFIENGVYTILLNSSIAAQLETALVDYNIYVLGPDLDARGISYDRILPNVSVVDYDDFVELAVTHSPVQSWFR